MTVIHHTATVETGARLGEDVEVGPYSLVGAEVELGRGVVIGPHAAVVGRTTIGDRTRIHAFAAIGGEPQDTTHDGQSTRLEVGRDNVIREHVTIHVGTSQGGGCTRIGDGTFIMNSAHIGHDCQVGSQCIISSFSGLAGHVTVDDFAVLGAYTGVHQRARVGESVMAAANTKLSQDAPPFALVAGDRARLVGLNSIGLRRREFTRESIQVLKRAFHILFQSRLRLQDALARTREELGESPEVARLLRFLEKSERGFCR